MELDIVNNEFKKFAEIIKKDKLINKNIDLESIDLTNISASQFNKLLSQYLKDIQNNLFNLNNKYFIM